MKATAEQLSDLKRRIAEADARSQLSRSEISKICAVHPSQVSRICRGHFRTISYNVVQVCTAIGLEVQTVKTSATKNDASWSKIEASARDIWDNSSEGADKIARILQTIGQLNR